jgi:cytochrome c biogenesis protein CcmG, thiol:disulfide interchange protein DsbE
VEEWIPVSETAQVEEKKGGGAGKYLIPALAVLVLIGLAFQGILEGQRQNRGDTAPGKQAPAFVMQRYDGGTVSLEQLRGKVVMLDFWATWCAPCVEEMPHLVKLAQEYEPKGVVFVAANRDEADVARYEVGRFLENKVKNLGPYIAFADDFTVGAYGVNVLPTLVLIDRKGQVHNTYTGYADEEVLRERLEEAMKE